jgi:hypothetical protein
MRNELLALYGVLTWMASGTLALAQDKPTDGHLRHQE